MSPSVAPQLVACGKRDFYRITEAALQVFEVAPVVPPAHIRGSKVARQTAETPIEAPHNVVSFVPGEAIVVANAGVHRFVLKGGSIREHRGSTFEAPLHVWADARRADGLWLRARDERTLTRYTIPVAKAPSDAAGEIVAQERAELAEFDGRLFTISNDGTVLYSTKAGVRRTGSDAALAPFPWPHGNEVVLFGDAKPGRYWSGDSSGNLTLWSEKATEKPKTAHVPGAILDADAAGTRVAVLSLELKGQAYRPTVTILEDGEQRAQLRVGESASSGGLPKLDLCLLDDRPWVVVGGRHWLQLLDWDTRRLLAEW